MRYWDSSAIVPLLATQSTTTIAETLLEDDPHLLIWWGTSVECMSALARLEREHALSHAEVGMAQARLRVLADFWNEVQPHVRVRATAERLLRVHPLRAADALQLGAALEASRGDPGNLSFVCFDRRLAEAGAREGLAVIDETMPRR